MALQQTNLQHIAFLTLEPINQLVAKIGPLPIIEPIIGATLAISVNVKVVQLLTKMSNFMLEICCSMKSCVHSQTTVHC